MHLSTINWQVQDGVAHITLRRPEAANSINLDMAKELLDVMLRSEEDPSIRAVLLSGAGSTFCAGGDLKSFALQGKQLAHHLKEVTAHLHTAISHLIHMERPVVAAIQGVAAGAGMALACACDVVVVAESARFIMAYTRVGLTPDGSSTFFLPRLVGFKRALELTLTNRMLSAQEALQWGIVTYVVPDAEVQARALNVAAQLASGPTAALGAAKRLLHRSWAATMETQMEEERHTIAQIACTSDAQEGIAAFLEKRNPKFVGD